MQVAERVDIFALAQMNFMLSGKLERKIDKLTRNTEPIYQGFIPEE